ncbi:MAG: type transport system ATP-binding protein [Bacteroidetes bacterium]|jgi:ABC-2 type transport system ATP-binding protein|nr:type transport system ATP-binding protein [Bacteroidota bacterium]
MLLVTHLRKAFDTVLAVDDVSFSVQRGEIFGLLGPNGAGKTTTIRVILKILEPDAGETTYDGRKFSDRTRDILGYMPEERGLYKKSKVIDAILYFAELRGMARGQAKAEAYRWLKRFALLEHAERKVEELSKGNQQKVQFITAVLHGPQLLVLDEPFSGLDPVNQILFKDILLELKREGKAIIFSTHQMEQAEKLSDSLCLINKGRVVLGGSVRDVKKRYGTNSLHLEFEGDGSFLNTLPGVSRSLIYPNSAELELTRDAKTQPILSELIGRLEVRKFELVEPSLQSIFIQVVAGVPAPRQLEAL